MSATKRLSSDFSVFLSLMFFSELAIGVFVAWIMLRLFHIDGVLMSMSPTGVIGFHVAQILIRYVSLSPVLAWIIFKKIKGKLKRIFLNVAIQISHALLLGVVVAGVWRIMFFKSGVITEGVSVWTEIIVASAIFGFLFRNPKEEESPDEHRNREPVD